MTDQPLSPAEVRRLAGGPMKAGMALVLVGVLTVAWAHLFAPSQEARDIARILGYATGVMGALSYGFGHLLVALDRLRRQKQRAEPTVPAPDET